MTTLSIVCGRQKSVGRIRSTLFLLRTLQPLRPGHWLWLASQAACTVHGVRASQECHQGRRGPGISGSLSASCESFSFKDISLWAEIGIFFPPITESESIKWMDRQGTETVLFFLLHNGLSVMLGKRKQLSETMGERIWSSSLSTKPGLLEDRSRDIPRAERGFS